MAELQIILKARGLKATKDNLKKLKGELKKTEKQAKKTEKGFKLFSVAGAKLTAVFAGITLAARKLVQIGNKLIDSFRAQEQASARLTQALRNQGFYSKEAQDRLQELASQLQKVTIFSDEETISAQAMLASFKLNADQIAKMTPLMQDLATMTAKTTGAQADMESIAKLMGLALEGQAGRLKQAGISLTDYQTELIQASDRAGKFNVLLEVMQQNAGGLAVAVGETATAATTILANKWDDLKEVLGEKIVKADYFQDFIKGLDVIIGKITEVTEKREKEKETEDLEADAIEVLIHLYKKQNNLTKVRGAHIDKMNNFVRERLILTKNELLHGRDMNKMVKDAIEREKQLEIQEKAEAQAKKLSAETAQDMIRTIQQEIDILLAKDDVTKETIRLDRQYKKALESVNLEVNKGKISEEDALKVKQKLNELRKESIRLINEESDALKKQAVFRTRGGGLLLESEVLERRRGLEAGLIERGILDPSRQSEEFRQRHTVDEAVNTDV